MGSSLAKVKLLQHNLSDLSRPTNIARVTDREIWSLLTPCVKAFLGPVLSAQLAVMETVSGLFPGDDVANLPDHRLYGGKPGYVRFPYLHSFYKTENGAVVIKRDGTSFKVFCWYGEVEKGSATLILESGLRDRRFDGTNWSNESALNPYPVDDPVACAQLKAAKSSVELSIYGFLPRSRIVQCTGNAEFDEFVSRPFKFLAQPAIFARYLEAVRLTDRAPGQGAAPIPDVSKIVQPALERIAQRHGYDFIEACPSHYHVAKFFEKRGFAYTLPAHQDTIASFTAGIARIKSEGVVLSRAEESWLCAAQSLPGKYIPAGWNLGGIKWPQDNIGQEYLWMNRRLSI